MGTAGDRSSASASSSTAQSTTSRRELARVGLAAYVRQPYFAELLEHHGFAEELERRHDALERDSRQSSAAVISDRVVEAAAIAGTARDVRGQLQRYEGLADFVVLSASPGHPPDVTREQVGRILSTFSPTRKV